MKTLHLLHGLNAVALAVCVLGCGSSSGYTQASPAEPSAQTSRYTIKNAGIELEVADVAATSARIDVAVKGRDGFIESSRKVSEDSASLSVRVPANQLKETVEEISQFGEVISSNFSEEDVSDQYSDLEAKLKNLRGFRDRLRALLDRATGVKDVLEIEEQLNRVQTELDQQEGRFKLLTGRIGLSTLSVSLEKKHIPGPLGIVLQCGGWLIEKLFVLD